MRGTTRSIRILVALSIAILLAILFTLLFSEDRTSMLFIGDLPGFYALGRLVLEGNGDHLYNLAYQQEVQNRFWPALNNTFLRPMYPPFAALYMAAFSWIPPIPLKCIIVFVDIMILWFTLCARSHNDRPTRLSLILFSLPILISIIGVQNTIVSIGLLTLTRRLLETHRRFASGVCAGLLLYKPQIGLLFSLVTAISAGPYYIAGISITTIIQYLLGCWVYKGEWLLPWVREINVFSSLRKGVDGFQMTSLAHQLPLEGWLTLSQQTWGLFVSVACFLGLLVYARVLQGKADKPHSALDLVAGVFPVFMPQTMFYDLGISIFWVFTAANVSSKRSLYFAIGIIVAVNMCIALRETDPRFTPLAALLVACYALRVFSCRDSSR